MLRLQTHLLSLLRRSSATFPPSLHLLGATAPTSTSSSSAFAVEDYLVATCGLTRPQALKASKSLSHLKSPSNSDAVVAFLSGLGLSRADIAALVAADPRLLCSRVGTTLTPRVDALRVLGLSASQIASVVAAGGPAIRSCDILTRLQFWIPLFGSFDQFIRTIRGWRCRCILTTSVDNVVKPNIAYLERCGLDARDIAKLHFNGYWLFTVNPERLKELVMRADNLGVPRSSGQFKYALAVVTRLSQERIDSKREVLKRALGCTEDLLRIAVIKNPGILRASEDRLRGTAKFLTTVVRLAPEYIVHRPALLTYSLKGRLVPRYLVMKAMLEQGIRRPDYCCMVGLTEKKFMSTYIDRHKKSIPGLAHLYAKALEGELPLQLQH